MDVGSHTWNINQQTLQRMKHAKFKQHFRSHPFSMAGLKWQIEIVPKGYHEQGTFDVYLHLVSQLKTPS